MDADAADANTADADAYEILGHHPFIPGTAIPEQGQSIELSNATRPPDNPPIQVDAANSEPTSDVVIECFPCGSPGAPVVDAHQGSTTYNSTQVMLGGSIWAPFHSQCDWEIVCWAKMHGPTSSAVTDLLAVKEVRSSHILFIISLTYGKRWLRGSASPTRQQIN